MTIWRPGMQAVCVDVEGAQNLLERNHVYTVARVALNYFNGTGKSVDGLYIEGVPMFATSVPWYASRFRPLIKTDISVFEAMLKSKKLEEV